MPKIDLSILFWLGIKKKKTFLPNQPKLDDDTVVIEPPTQIDDCKTIQEGTSKANQ